MIGNDLRHIGLYAPDSCFTVAEKLGYKVEYDAKDNEGIIHGPDSLDYLVKVDAHAGKRSERFFEIGLNVSDMKKAQGYYGCVLGMKAGKTSEKYSSFAYPGVEFLLILQDDVSVGVYLVEEKIDHGKAFGRMAFSCGDEAVQPMEKLFTECSKQYGGRIHTDPVKLDTPGKATVEVIILADPHEYEICMVGEKGFLDLCELKDGDEVIDWKERINSGSKEDK